MLFSQAKQVFRKRREGMFLSLRGYGKQKSICKVRSNSHNFIRFCRIWAAFVFVNILIFISGCVENSSFIGDCTAETKAKIQNSLMFISADVFLPAGEPVNFEKLPDKKLRSLHSRLQEILTQICERHNLRHEKISIYISLPLRQNIESRLILTNTGKPLIHVEVNGDVVLDLRVLQALYRSALITGLEGVAIDEVEVKAKEKPEHERIEEFVRFKNKVENTSAFPKWLDTVDFIIDALFLNSMSEWTCSQWDDFASTAAVIDERYSGTILFLFAHEIGHLSIGHLDAPPTEEDPNWLTRIELQADRYAATILNDAYLGENIFAGQEKVTFIMSGYELYFQLAEKMVGFHEDSTVEGRLYPTSKQRINAAREIGERVIVERLKELGYEYNWWIFGGWGWRKKPIVPDVERSD